MQSWIPVLFYVVPIYLFGPNWNYSDSLSTSPDQTNQASKRLGGKWPWQFQTVKPKNPQWHIDSAIGGRVGDGGVNPAIRHTKFDKIKILE